MTLLTEPERALPGSGPTTAATGTPRSGRRRGRRTAESGTATRSLISDLELARPRARVLYFLTLTGTVVVFAAAFLFPLYWMVTAALKTPAQMADNTVGSLVPTSFQLSNYADAWNEMHIAHFFLNTVYYAAGGWFIQIVVDVTTAYALSKLRPVFGRAVFGMMLASLMLPATALLVPAYLNITSLPFIHLNLLNSPWGLWLPGAANAFNVYVLKRFFDQIPDELLDAASIDGASRLQILGRIILPLSRPVLAVISILSVIGIWKDFLWPMLVLQDPEAQTLSVALQRLSATTQVPPTEMIAGLAIASVPMVVVFLVFQRHILAGLSAGAVKG
ncbi:carbohydrate ABC transporter permease [Streptacidiphilus sp. N1-12]|uniref:Carbohydrate ABC transporter permease n=2 Tax=Streptacidiphilus alkalitolerans TaxID=3342712 RepID=A0ABV6VDI1_9ACTN